MKTKIIFILLVLFTVTAAQQKIYIKENYYKKEYRVPVRDGITLFTSVYIPKDDSKTYPVLLVRTPYSVSPYGEDTMRTYLANDNLVKEGYIFAFQDVRGKFMSEGEFVDMRPFNPNKTGNETDEASDTYDTIEWMINNIPNNNGKVGIYGISYPGFYAAQAAMSNHPALKAVSPQAPISDWFIGDDMHHNGAFTLLLSFNFFKVFGQPRDTLTTSWGKSPEYDSPDAYTFFLNMGPLQNANNYYLNDGIPFWNEQMQHGSYDDFWQSRSTLFHFDDIKTNVMTVGGWFDGEDLFGAVNTYQVIEQKNPKKQNTIVMGPWTHGGWARSAGTSLGEMKFDLETSKYYQDEIELPFFNFYLKGKGSLKIPEALIFETGGNKWHKFNQWPPKNVDNVSLYFATNEELKFDEKNTSMSYDEFPSDPGNPVPYTAAIRDSRSFYNKTYMVEDQRFASNRPDVLIYQTEPLEEDFTIAGPITADLFVSTTGTDADWVVKVIDVFPYDAENPDPNPAKVEMGGYQLMVRYEIFRGKFRNTYDKPEPFVPNQVTNVNFILPDIMHTFKKGHRIMVQVQSSMFPLFDRNPQTFCDIYTAGEEDFQKATHRVYTSYDHPSRIVVKKFD
ncbi:MAG: CocE/NonD family hydrolase [Melioribacteraceae bacterium]|nr:CocE/NonD family hydrolase [Melioribacteraceae bacterium]MCF8353924.1 CocE/NonD family hydrolase [Melioribacteraceae bacterium]MCF8392681.1 CocE/NonD family hydrolase [Melioribacteraceae bacterium]MCF8417702.1 CocE/NonD family hydrolase [Melioribacteraceae bacterium]